MKPAFAVALPLAVLWGCATNPVTGRDQIVALPAVQAHADLAFALSSGAQRAAAREPCGEACRGLRLRFSTQVERIGAELQVAARSMSPESFQRMESFSIGVDPDLGMSTGSSAGGRIMLGEGIAGLEPAEEVIAFLIAREMAHVIARHDEEDSGARIVFSALTTLLPFTLIARIIASTLGSGALVGSWAEEQRREADEIAVALLVRTGRSPVEVAQALDTGIRKDLLPEGEWAARYLESASRVTASAGTGPKYADFNQWLLQQSIRSIERLSACARSGIAGETQEAALARRRDCMGDPHNLAGVTRIGG